MPKLLLAASILWPTLLGAGWWSRTHDGPGWLTATTHFVASRVCHQNPARSFWAGGAPLPVCGRCTAIYLAAPFGALAALLVRRSSTEMPWIGWLIAAAIPTAATYALEKFAGVGMSTVARALAAVPLGAVTAFYVVAITKKTTSPRLIN